MSSSERGTDSSIPRAAAGAVVDDGRRHRMLKVASSLFFVTAEIATLFGLLAFTISSWLNIQLFDAWNLQFLRIATLSDVTTSGLFASSLLIGYLLFGGIVFLFVTSLIGYAAPLVWRPFSKFVVALIALIASIAALLTLRGYDIQFPNGAYSAVGSGAIALATINFYTANEPRESVRIPSHYRPVIGVIMGMAVLALFGNFISGELKRKYRDEFAASELFITAKSDDCFPKHVLWIGEKSIVTECIETKKIAIVAASDAVRMVQRPDVGSVEYSTSELNAMIKRSAASAMLYLVARANKGGRDKSEADLVALAQKNLPAVIKYVNSRSDQPDRVIENAADAANDYKEMMAAAKHPQVARRKLMRQLRDLSQRGCRPADFTAMCIGLKGESPDVCGRLLKAQAKMPVCNAPQ